MKRALVFTFIFALLSGIFAHADTEKAYVTISNGSPVLINKQVALSDLDGDGSITVNDALIAAHGEGQYGYEITAYGISMTKLWGIANGGAYGYYVNNAPAMSLSDEISNGDSVYAYIYTDTEGFSDTYCYFDRADASAVTNEQLTLTLTKTGYDADWSFSSSPFSNAVITVNGEPTEYVTDENGNVTVKFEGEGVYTVSAICEGMTLVPPVCTVTVTEVPQTGDFIFPLIAIFLCSVFVLNKKVCVR